MSKVIFLAAIVCAVAACDDDKAKDVKAPASATAVESVATAATAAPTASQAAAPAKIKMPPRPVPIGSSGPIQPSAPQEDQIMAINYTIAMMAPQGMDPQTVDKTYLDSITKKLEGAVRTADKGKTPPDPIKVEHAGRKIKVEMGKGCTDKVPSNLIAQRAGSSLKEAYEAGVLVISCHDDKWECHQSTRDPADVLCHASPRH